MIQKEKRWESLLRIHFSDPPIQSPQTFHPKSKPNLSGTLTNKYRDPQILLILYRVLSQFCSAISGPNPAHPTSSPGLQPIISPHSQHRRIFALFMTFFPFNMLFLYLSRRALWVGLVSFYLCYSPAVCLAATSLGTHEYLLNEYVRG